MADAINFFATQRDLASVLSAVEAKRYLQYVRAGLTEPPAPKIMTSWQEIPQLGVVSLGSQSQEVRYLILESETDVIVRQVPQPRGAMLYAVDQKSNPRSIGFWPGGVVEALAICAGEVSTCSEDPVSWELLNLFAVEIQQQFAGINSTLVGPEAEQLFDAGYRLTTSVHAPRAYDLSRD